MLDLNWTLIFYFIALTGIVLGITAVPLRKRAHVHWNRREAGDPGASPWPTIDGLLNVSGVMLILATLLITVSAFALIIIEAGLL